MIVVEKEALKQQRKFVNNINLLIRGKYWKKKGLASSI